MVRNKIIPAFLVSLLVAGCLPDCNGDGAVLKCPLGTRLEVENESDDVKAAAGEPFTFDDIFDTRFNPNGFSHTWLYDSNEFSRLQSEGVVIRNVDTDETTTLVPASELSGVTHYWVSEDRAYVLLAYDYQKRWRHSFEARYKMWNIATQESTDFPMGPLAGEVLQIAKLGTKGHSAVFVFGNNLYYQANMVLPSIQITSDGEPDVIFNGIPDWMYEEDVLGSAESFYFSKDSGHVIFARHDVTGVPHQAWPEYGSADNMFPNIRSTPYPKAGDLRDGHLGPTTKVQLYAFSTANLGAGIKRVMPPHEFVGADHYFNQVNWRDGHNAVITWLNRVQNRTIQMICDVYEDTPVCTEFWDFTQEGGWVGKPPQRFVNNGRNMVTILQDPGTEDLFKQMTYMSTPEQGHGVVLFHTLGVGQVYSVVGFDEELQHIFYITNNGDTTERMLFRAGPNDNDRNPVCLTCNRGPGCRYVSATFSGDGKHYILGCHGPDVPEYFLKHVADDGAEEILEDNAEHKAAIANKDIPQREFINVQINGDFGQAEIFKPPNFDETEQYPLFIYTYAGPESSLVYKTYPVGGSGNNWLRYLGSSHNVIVAAIDGRGSTGRGDKFTFKIYRKLGDVEVQDQIEGTRDLRELPYVDTSVPTVIYGWSYGGHTAAHALGDPSDVFQCGVAVAPVINKRFYDSAFSEKFLGFATADDNAGGYEREDVLNRVQYFKGKQFFVAHGTADDNVHFMHMTHLVNELQNQNIPHHQMMYIDTNHNIAEPANAKHIRKAKSDFILNTCWKGKYGGI